MVPYRYWDVECFISNIFLYTQNKHTQIIVFERVFNYATIDVLFLFIAPGDQKLFVVEF